MDGCVVAKKTELQFSWGKKGGVGGSKKNHQFYKSFTLDNVEYSIYDCVYLYKTGESEPYIGKIFKILEYETKSKEKEKKVRILWFFRPSEIKNYLGDYVVSEKEIFLASGEGPGLFNTNPLEAIAGKCSVICTSKDERNPQPSKEDLEMADYIFSCTFNVQNYTISQKIDDQIAGIEAKYLFNRIDDLKPRPVNNPEDNVICQNGEADQSATHPGAKDAQAHLGTKLNENAKSASTSTVGNGNSAQAVLDEKTCVQPMQLADAPNDLDKDDLKPSKMKANFDADEVRHSKKAKLEENPIKFAKDAPNDRSKLKEKKANSSEEPHQKMASDNDEKPGVMTAEVTKRPNSDELKLSKMKSSCDTDDVRHSKKEKLEENSIKLAKDASSDRLKLKEKKANPSEEPQQKVASKNDENPDIMTTEVTKRTDADRSKWFKLPWISKLRKADAQGKLVLIENLDPSYTSSEIEGVINDIFKENCTVKVIPQGSFQNPNYSQAYAIFRTRDAANMVVSRINQGCLLQPNGSPLICSIGLLDVPDQENKGQNYRGHLSIDKVKLREEMKSAVSTSHCSQPNTIEYEMAAEWIVLHENYRRYANCLYKEQLKEQNLAKRNLHLK